MPTNIQNVSFASPAGMLAPDLLVQQQQTERQQQLAAALRQMSLDQIDAGKGNIAWTQGAAKLAQALAGVIVQRRVDKQQITLAQAMSNRLNGSRAYGYTDPSPPSNTPAPPKMSISLPTAGTGMPPPASRPVDPQASPTTINVPDNPTMRDPAPVVQRPSSTMPQPGQVDSLAPLPDAPPPQMAPQAPAQQATSQPMPQQADQPSPVPQAAPAPQQGTFHPGPLTLTGDPDRDRYLSIVYPEEFGKAVLANAAPVEMARTVQQAKAALAAGDTTTAIALLSKVNHDNYVAPLSGRGGNTIRDPFTHQVIGYDAPPIEGAVPDYDANGNVAGYHAAPGAAGAMQLKSAAEAAGRAGYTPTQVLGNDGNYHTVPLTNVPGFGGGNPPPAPAGPGAPPPGRSGTLGGYFNGGRGAGGPPANNGNVSGLGPKGQTAATTSGTNSANAYQAAIDAGQSAPDSLRSLDQIIAAAKDLPTGTGAGTLSAAKSGFNALADGLGITSQVNPIIDKMGYQVGFDRDRIAKFDELKKQVSQLASQVSSGPGSTGTDARLNNAIAALPGSNYSPAAIQELSLNLKARTQSKKDFGIAAAQDMATNGSENYPNFAAQWQKAYNPDIYYQMQKGPAAYSQWFKSIPSATARAHVLQQYRTLKAMGAFQ